MSKHIFPPWDFSRWKAVDDRVRGGASQSHLDAVDLGSGGPGSYSEDKRVGARFWGTLDIDTLGGAGFASQRYIFAPRPLSLPRHRYCGITLTTLPDTTTSTSTSSGGSSHSAHTFTLVLKTSPTLRSPKPNPKLPPNPEPASLSYEISFTPETDLKSISWNFNFNDFIPTYRGREIKRDDPLYQPLHPESIYELSLMCRSGFGDQKGEFGVVVENIAGWEKGRGVVEVVWGVISVIVFGMFAWIAGVFKGEGSVTLGDEEKDPLV